MKAWIEEMSPEAINDFFLDDDFLLADYVLEKTFHEFVMICHNLALTLKRVRMKVVASSQFDLDFVGIQCFWSYI
jgi:hypothetical protein